MHVHVESMIHWKTETETETETEIDTGHAVEVSKPRSESESGSGSGSGSGSEAVSVEPAAYSRAWINSVSVIGFLTPAMEESDTACLGHETDTFSS